MTGRVRFTATTAGETTIVRTVETAFPTLSVAVTTTRYVPGAPNTWDTDGPDADDPSPKSQLIEVDADRASTAGADSATRAAATARAGTATVANTGGAVSNSLRRRLRL